MKKKLHVLIVEDSEDSYQIIVRASRSLNREEEEKGDDGVTLELHRATTFNAAEALLRDKTLAFDAAVVDIRLAEDTHADEADTAVKMGGRKVVELIFEVFQLPMFVYTGTPGHIEALRSRESDFFKIYTRDQTVASEILQHIIDIHRGGVLSLLGDDGIVQTFGKHFHQIFWTHLASAGKYWLAEDNRDVLKRYVVQHMMEYLEQSSLPEHAGFVPAHPAEMYITPSVKQKAYTGDILRESANGNIWLVLTPSCDMVFQNEVKDPDAPGGVRYERNAAHIVLARLTPWHAIDGMPKDVKALTNANIKYLEKVKSKLRFSFLPKYQNLDAAFVDFQQLTSVAENKIDTDAFERLASVSAPFLKDIIARFSYYYSRQGAPILNGKMSDWL